ncbi:hypothetical protein [Streptomyces coeruleorubidus]|uniref:hypothetical protein n=1 Tax=Streptomyces coeruleorubidus TaxID=116188 RepID=UPI0033AEE92A
MTEILGRLSPLAGRRKRPPSLGAGQRIRFDHQVRGVLEVTAQAAVLEDAEAPHRVVALIDLFEAPDFEILFQPRAGYEPGTSATSRQGGKAAELSAAGHSVAAKTVGNRRCRHARSAEPR